MEDSHYGIEVMSVEEHASVRRREALAAEAVEAGPSVSQARAEEELETGTEVDREEERVEEEEVREVEE